MMRLMGILNKLRAAMLVFLALPCFVFADEPTVSQVFNVTVPVLSVDSGTGNVTVKFWQDGHAYIGANTCGNFSLSLNPVGSVVPEENQRIFSLLLVAKVHFALLDVTYDDVCAIKAVRYKSTQAAKEYD
jgi:hypothetical protein